MSSDDLNREIAFAGQRVKQKVIFALTLASVIPLLILTPLTFLGGSFYSINMLPPVWQTVTLFNPVVYLVSGFRSQQSDTRRRYPVEAAFQVGAIENILHVLKHRTQPFFVLACQTAIALGPMFAV